MRPRAIAALLALVFAVLPWTARGATLNEQLVSAAAATGSQSLVEIVSSRP
ncbi:MAG TPA: hypothetical protein VJO54_08075 [Burkholderiales bacterium]|nr:hypothetical protein [Burkholderiales bacterium]